MFTNEEVKTEQWKSIPGFPGYSASTLGRIRRDARVTKVPMIGGSYERKFGDTVLSQIANGRRNLPAVQLRDASGKPRRRDVINLLVHTWFGIDMRHHLVEIRFKDGNEYNYRLENLEVM